MGKAAADWEAVAGPAVVVSWIVLACSGRWAPGRDWLDRTGRLLGACWIGIAAIDLAIQWLMWIRF